MKLKSGPEEDVAHVLVAEKYPDAVNVLLSCTLQSAMAELSSIGEYILRSTAFHKVTTLCYGLPEKVVTLPLASWNLVLS